MLKLEHQKAALIHFSNILRQIKMSVNVCTFQEVMEVGVDIVTH